MNVTDLARIASYLTQKLSVLFVNKGNLKFFLIQERIVVLFAYIIIVQYVILLIILTKS